MKTDPVDTVSFSRRPSPGEIKFGYGSRHFVYVTEEEAKNRKFITINGKRYSRD
jgi:hypothetical protein